MYVILCLLLTLMIHLFPKWNAEQSGTFLYFLLTAAMLILAVLVGVALRSVADKFAWELGKRVASGISLLTKQIKEGRL